MVEISEGAKLRIAGLLILICIIAIGVFIIYDFWIIAFTLLWTLGIMILVHVSGWKYKLFGLLMLIIAIAVGVFLLYDWSVVLYTALWSIGLFLFTTKWR